ncbi:class I SAM-dependent methyltransferase [Candidatus Promineifilum breve]|nr:class I SAM-dependent methyltransferase [Candidatus Promineifilum breve]
MLKPLKQFIGLHFPFLVRNWRRIKFHPKLVGSREEVFNDIYRKRIWGDPESISGTGSNLAQTAEIRRLMPPLLDELGCRSLLDVPCGDFYWMRLLDLDQAYTGGDIVADLIERNQREYGNEHRRFIHVDLVQDQLPTADLLLCRDCLVHLCYADIFRALVNIKSSGCEYLLTTTYPSHERNHDTPTGSWRALALHLPPFNFPSPLRLIDEKCPDLGYEDKHLGLWRVADLPHYPIDHS